MDSPANAQLQQSVDLLNGLLIRLMGGQDGAFPNMMMPPQGMPAGPLPGMPVGPPAGMPFGMPSPPMNNPYDPMAGLGMSDPPAIILKDPNDPRRDAQIFAETQTESLSEGETLLYDNEIGDAYF